jgi:hypothetical protein
MKEPNHLDLYLDSPEELESILYNNKHKLTVTIAEFLIWALESNVDDFIFAEVLVRNPESESEEHVITLGCKREDYHTALEKQLKNLIEFEEFEMCPKLQEWIDYLDVEEKVKK